jgi:hypothetical protein
MKPLFLKKPTTCCNSAELEWLPAKMLYICKCGRTVTDMDGHRRDLKGRLWTRTHREECAAHAR